MIQANKQCGTPTDTLEEKEQDCAPLWGGDMGTMNWVGIRL